jgi:hypothetical protein
MHFAQRLYWILPISLLLDKPGIRVCHGQDAAIQGNLLPTQLPMMQTELRPACALLAPGVQTSSASFLVSAVLWCRPGERRSRPSFTDTSRQAPTCLRSLRSGASASKARACVRPSALTICTIWSRGRCACLPGGLQSAWPSHSATAHEARLGPQMHLLRHWPAMLLVALVLRSWRYFRSLSSYCQGKRRNGVSASVVVGNQARRGM